MKRKAMFCYDASRNRYENYYTSQTGNASPPAASAIRFLRPSSRISPIIMVSRIDGYTV